MAWFAPHRGYAAGNQPGCQVDEFKRMVRALHQAGIEVILDVVFNHMGPGDLTGNLLEYDGEEIYFYPEDSPFRETPWGPRPDYGRTEVRNYIRDSVEAFIFFRGFITHT